LISAFAVAVSASERDAAAAAAAAAAFVSVRHACNRLFSDSHSADAADAAEALSMLVAATFREASSSWQRSL
jgi:hypothetical protein